MANEPEVNPFESPETADTGRPTSPFESGHRRAQVACLMFALCFGVSIFSAGSNYFQIELIDRATSYPGVRRAEFQSNDTRQSFVLVLTAVVQLLTAAAFLLWFHRAHRNLPALGAHRLRFSPGWAVGCWFIPILNLFYPLQIMKEIWKGSDPKGFQLANALKRPYRGAPVLLGWWWALHLTAGSVGWYAFNLSRTARAVGSVGALHGVTWAALVADLAAATAAVLASSIIRTVDQNQQQRHDLCVESAREAAPGSNDSGSSESGSADAGPDDPAVNDLGSRDAGPVDFDWLK